MASSSSSSGNGSGTTGNKMNAAAAARSSTTAVAVGEATTTIRTSGVKASATVVSTELSADVISYCGLLWRFYVRTLSLAVNMTDVDFLEAEKRPATAEGIWAERELIKCNGLHEESNSADGNQNYDNIQRLKVAGDSRYRKDELVEEKEKEEEKEEK